MGDRRSANSRVYAKGPGLKASTSTALWRALVIVLAVCASIQLGIEWFSAPRVLTRGVVAEPLFTGGYLKERGPIAFVVEGVPADSPLRAADVVPGDRLRFDEPLGRWYNRVAGDKVALTVIHGAGERRVDVTLTADRNPPRYRVINYVLDAATTVLALVMGLVVGLRTDSVAFRALALTGLLGALRFAYSAPESIHLSWLDFMGSASTLLFAGVMVFFALNYPDDRPVGWRARVLNAYKAFFALVVAAALVYLGRLYAGQFEPLCWQVLRVADAVGPALFVAALTLAWREARGESRLRLQWILLTLGVLMAAILLAKLNAWTGRPIPAETFDLCFNAVQLLATIGFVYAVFRHRIFDLGLAVNRTLVYAIVSMLLFGVIQAGHAFAGAFLQVDDKNKAALLSAILALTVFLLFSQLKKGVERVVDRLLFSRWTERETALRRFVEQAHHASDAAALGRLFVAAADRFTDGAGCALYHRQDDGRYARVVATRADMPPLIDANDETVLALQAHGKGVRPHATLHGAELALPMRHRGRLNGFALLGPRPDAAPFRPDQIEALEFAAHQIGLDFHALRVEALELQLAGERQATDKVRAQLATAMQLATGRPPTL
jgi:hypothetical protein